MILDVCMKYSEHWNNFKHIVSCNFWGNQENSTRIFCKYGSHNHMIISSDDSQMFIEKYLWPCVGREIVYNTCSALES